MGPCGSGKQFTCLATFYILTVYKSYCQFYIQVIFNSLYREAGLLECLASIYSDINWVHWQNWVISADELPMDMTSLHASLAQQRVCSALPLTNAGHSTRHRLIMWYTEPASCRNASIMHALCCTAYTHHKLVHRKSRWYL